MMNEVFIERSRQLFESKRYRSSAELVSRGFEFIDKFSLTLRHVKKIVDGVQSRSRIKDLPWPAFKFEEAEQRLKELRTGLLQLLGKMVPMLGFMPDDPTLPDFFGQCYVKVLEETFMALIRDDYDLFKEFFPISFIGGMTAFDKLEKHVANWDRTVAFAVRADVLIDIIELGSYAKFFSEYRGHAKYWDVCMTAWDGFLSSHVNGKILVDFIVSLVNFRDNQFMLSTRKSCRLRWEQELMSYLRQEGSLVAAVYMPGRRAGPHPHSSKLVRMICTTGGIGIDWPGPELFLIAYFEVHRKSEKPLQIRDRHRMRMALGVDSEVSQTEAFDNFFEE